MPPRAEPLSAGAPRPPRGLILLASAWLLLSWLAAFGVHAPVQAQSASYTPGVRVMLISVAMGILIGWPLLRLSGPARPWPIRQSLLDLVVLLFLAQVVVWPLRLVTPWTAGRSALIDLCLGGWAVACAALVAAGSGVSPRRDRLLRSVCMLVALAFVAFGPLRMMALDRGSAFGLAPASHTDARWWESVSLSPVAALHALSGGGAVEPTAIEWRAASFGWLVSIGAWIATIALRIAARRGAPARRAEEATQAS